MLLESGADPNATNAYGDTPLHMAATTESVEGLRMLLAAGADPDARNQIGARPLHAAVQSDASRDIMGAPSKAWMRVEALLTAGANPEARMDNGASPLLWAARHDDPTTAAVLLTAGADPESRTDEGDTPLAVAQRHYRQYSPFRRVKGVPATLQAIRRQRAAALMDLLRMHGARE